MLVGACGHVMALHSMPAEWARGVRFRLRTLLAAISLKEPVFTGVTSLPAPANLDGVLTELKKAQTNPLEMMHELGLAMQYRTTCAPPGPSLRKPALL